MVFSVELIQDQVGLIEGDGLIFTGEECDMYRHVENGDCADACIPTLLNFCPRPLIVGAGKLEAGLCAEVGYSVENGEFVQKAGPCGILTFSKYLEALSSTPAIDLHLDEPSSMLPFFTRAVASSSNVFRWDETSGLVQGDVFEAPRMSSGVRRKMTSARALGLRADASLAVETGEFFRLADLSRTLPLPEHSVQLSPGRDRATLARGVRAHRLPGKALLAPQPAVQATAADVSFLPLLCLCVFAYLLGLARGVASRSAPRRPGKRPKAAKQKKAKQCINSSPGGWARQQTI
jgi:hypothetical protein